MLRYLQAALLLYKKAGFYICIALTPRSLRGVNTKPFVLNSNTFNAETNQSNYSPQLQVLSYDSPTILNF